MADFYSGKEWKAGILAEATFGTAQAASAAFVQLPLPNVQMPVNVPQRGGGIRSGNEGMIVHDDDIHQTQRGGSVTWDFEMAAELEFMAQFLASIMQNHAESGAGPYIHTMNYGYTGGAKIQSRPDFLGSITDGIPAFYTIAIEPPRANSGIILTSAILRSLTLEFDQNNHEGRAWFSGQFESFMSSASSYLLEQDLSGTWVKRTQNYLYPGFTTKTLTVDGTTPSILIPRVSFTITPFVDRKGRDANGDAEDAVWGTGENAIVINGSMDVCFNDLVNMEATKNILQHFIDKANATLTLQIGDGTVSTAGEMNIAANIQYTGNPELKLDNEPGAMWTLPFQVVQATSGGSPTNTDALKFVIADSTPDTSW